MATRNVISPDDLDRVVSLLEQIATNCATLRELCIDALDAHRHVTSASAAVDIAKLTGALADHAATIAQGWPGTFGEAATEWLLPMACEPQQERIEDLAEPLRVMPADEVKAWSGVISATAGP